MGNLIEYEDYFSEADLFLREIDIVVNLLLDNIQDKWDIYNKQTRKSAEKIFAAVSILHLINNEHIKLLASYSEQINDEYEEYADD